MATMASETKTDIPFVPEDAQLVYLTEGAANIVYIVRPRYPTPTPGFQEEYSSTTPPPTIIEDDDGDQMDLDVFDNKLLRLRKDLPTTLAVAIAQDQWERWVKPLFKDDQIVHQQLIRLGPGKVIERLNEELQIKDAQTSAPIPGKISLRPIKRRGVYLANDEHGLLVTDMSPVGQGDAEVIEFKPKWLSQSPSAPKNSKRCRQCAITACRNQELATKYPPEELLKAYCPLDLVSGVEKDALYAAKILLAPERKLANVDRFAKWIFNNPLLTRLKEVQSRLDKLGPLKADAKDWKYRVAMTLRDCTMFVRFPEDREDDEEMIEARIGDLDVKSVDKGPYWKETEEMLIKEGWYTGTEQWTTARQQPITCRLGRTFDTRDHI